MRLKEHLEFNRMVARHIDGRKFFGWFLGLVLPLTIAMGLLIQWHNHVVGQVRPIHLLLRMGIVFVGYTFVGIVVYFKAVRPALRKAAEEIEQRTPTPKNNLDQP